MTVNTILLQCFINPEEIKEYSKYVTDEDFPNDDDKYIWDFLKKTNGNTDNLYIKVHQELDPDRRQRLIYRMITLDNHGAYLKMKNKELQKETTFDKDFEELQVILQKFLDRLYATMQKTQNQEKNIC